MKKIIIGVLVVIGLAALYLVYQNINRKSPAAEAKYSGQGVDISVAYGRPSKKDRLIFGSEDAGAVVPFGQYWRTGANESTEITFSQAVIFGGQPVEAGTYRLYTIPGPTEWTFALNSELGTWGYMEPDYAKDVTKVKAAPEAAPAAVEQFTIQFAPISGDTVALQVVWDRTAVSLPISPKK